MSKSRALGCDLSDPNPASTTWGAGRTGKQMCSMPEWKRRIVERELEREGERALGEVG